MVVPKAYYADIIWNYVLPELDPETSGIEIVTMARFDGTHAYDRILVVGNLIGKHFDIFRCMSSAEITVLLYEAEAVMFHAREKRSRVTERCLMNVSARLMTVMMKSKKMFPSRM